MTPTPFTSAGYTQAVTVLRYVAMLVLAGVIVYVASRPERDANATSDVNDPDADEGERFV